MKARQNPFRSDRVEAYRYGLDESGWEAVIKRLKNQGFRGLILGPHGSGKTVFMEDLRERFIRGGAPPESVPLYTLQDGFTREDRRTIRKWVSSLSVGDIFFLDGTEWLPPLFRMLLGTRFPVGAGWVCTGHRPLANLPVLWQTQPQPDIAVHMVETLIGRPLEPGERQSCHDRYLEAGGNMRTFLRALYHDADRAFAPLG